VEINTKQLSILATPLQRIATACETTTDVLKQINTIVIGLNVSAIEIIKELKNQTDVLLDIKSLLKKQKKQNESNTDSGNSGGPIKMPGIIGSVKTGFAIVVMAGALVAASGILTYMARVSPEQILTAIAIGALFLILVPVFIKISDAFKGPGLVDRIIGKVTGVGNGTNPSMKTMIAGVGLAMTVMAAGVALSSYFFAMVKPITLEQFATAVLIGIAYISLSLSFGLITKALTKGGITADKQGIKTLTMVTLSMIAIALGTVGVAYAFMLMPDNPKAPDLLWTIKASLAIGLFSVGFSFILKSIKDKTFKDILFASLAIPVMALTIVGIAYVFQLLPENSQAPDPLWTLKSGFAILAFSLPFFIVSKAIKGMGLKELMFMTIAIPIIAFGIVASAWIFQGLSGIENYAPSADFSMAAGIALIIFAGSLWIIGKITGKEDIKIMMRGIFDMIIISVAIVAVAWVFSVLPGSFVSPPLDWTLQAALAIAVFAIPIGIIGAIAAATGGGIEAAILGGVIGIILIAAGIWAVAWILSKVPTEFVGGMESLAKGLMAPVNSMIDAFARLKNEIGIENLPALAGGIVLLAGAWLTLVGALAGQAIGGLGASIANLGKSIIDGISSFFGGEKTKSPIDLLDMILNRANAITTISKPMETVATSFGKIAGYTGRVVKGLGAWGIFIEEKNAKNLERSADASKKIADSYTKFAKAANGLNIKAVQASTAMFTSIANLSKPDAQNAMKTLTQELLKAVEELSKTVVNLETAVEKQGDSNSGLIEETGKAIGGFVEKVTGIVTNTDTKVNKSVPITPEQQKAEQVKVADNTALSKDIATLTQALNMLVQKFNDSTGTNAPYVRVAQ
jgi:hypothetical protein